MNWKKLITLDNQFQADLLTDALGKAEIPFLVREYKDTAYDGLFVTQKGWGTIMVDETQLEEAKAIAKIDKNSLWRGLNIQKGELCVKGIWTKFMGENYPRPRLDCSFRFEVLHSRRKF